ncbi:glycosyltransferase family 2 protein [Pseudarthrobacter oxydans]|uniref:glycosyltransferase family 2 protein n=1 Tax=Pseudarthrobacter oxydans TaxID=1671 RepID=UPI00381E62F7
MTLTKPGHPANPPIHVVVTIATYKRPESLSALLTSLSLQRTAFTHKVVVVDNDVAASAKEVVSEVAPDAVYLVESRPSISAARNAGVAEALRFRPWALAFIDDDEVADERWLQELVNSMQQHSADVVTGPVEYVLPGKSADYKYFQKLERPSGSDVKYVATNNALVRAHWFATGPQLRFDDKFGLSGGEDLEIFLRLQKLGGKCTWTQDALVTSHVQPERLKWIWHMRRELRNGQLIARLRREFEGYSRLRLIAEGLRLATAGAGRGILHALQGKVSTTVQFQIVAGIGWIRAGLGIYYLEYSHDRVARSDGVPRNRSFSKQGQV